MSLRMQIVMTADEARVLYDLSDRERRTPREQAAVLLADALKRRAATFRRRAGQFDLAVRERDVRHAS